MENSVSRTPKRADGLRMKGRRGEKGNLIIEFALIGPFMVLVLIGVVGVGFMLSRSVQVAQVARDTAHMFFDGVDFSVVGNQNVVARLGSGMGWTLSSPNPTTGSTLDPNGNGVVILSQIIMVGANECNAAGYPNTTTCPNFRDLVIERRIVMGNSALMPSNFGTPTAVAEPDGTYPPNIYCSDASLVVASGSAPTNLNLAPGQFTYGVEAYFTMPALAQMFANNTYSYILM